MNYEEQIVNDYLATISQDVQYEPDGNIPPDFLIDNNIAIEVRRLNQNLFSDLKTVGLEQDRYKIINSLNEVFEKYENQNEDKSYWVGLHLSRPIGKILKIKKTAERELNSFLSSKPQLPYTIKLSNNIEIMIINCFTKRKEKFVIGLETDFDSGGLVTSMYIDNINFCISEKSQKISHYISKYNEWWLVLVDYIGDIFALREYEYNIVIQNILKNSNFVKVIILDPRTKKVIINI